MSEGWTESAQAWIADMGEKGDWGRQHVLDPAMLARLRQGAWRKALDVGCGEGRFCRLLASEGITATGIDPTLPLLEEARRRHPAGDYREAVAERLPFEAGSFDLVVSCMNLLDVEHYDAAIGEMTRVLAPGGTLLVANLNGFVTARADADWLDRDDSHRMHRYLEERAQWESWRGIRVRNWHRPLSAYMRVFLRHGLVLSHFDEPGSVSGDATRAAKYAQAPWYLLLEWRKPAAIVPAPVES